MPWIQSLLAEHSIWEVYRKSPRFWTNAFNVSVLSIVVVLLSVFAVVHLSSPSWASYVSSYSLNDTMILWAGQGLTYTATMLAFFLAGFTVFSTLTKPRLLAELAQIPHTKGRAETAQVSELQFVFFSFINIFVHYLCFLALSACIVFLDTKNGPLVFFGEIVKRASSPHLFDALQHLLFVATGAWFALLLLKLKSFVWNMYQMVLVVIAAENTDARLE